MATCSITDPFEVDAELFYKAIEAAEKATEEEKKHSTPHLTSAVQLKGSELKNFMERIRV
jgi:hypothetical protein